MTLKNLFKRRKTLTPSNNSMIVTEINPDSDEISYVLGISNERRDFLNQKLKYLLVEEKTFTKMFEEISKETVHPNELAYCCFNIGGIAQSNGLQLSEVVKLIKKLKDEDNGTD